MTDSKTMTTYLEELAALLCKAELGWQQPGSSAQWWNMQPPEVKATFQAKAKWMADSGSLPEPPEERDEPTDLTTERGRRIATARAVFGMAAWIEQQSLMNPLQEDFDAVMAAAEPIEADDRDAGPRFVAALVRLAAGCVVRLADQDPDDLRNIHLFHRPARS